MPPPDLFDEIYARGRPIDATLKTLTAQFSETTESPLLVRPLVSQGTIAVVRPLRVAMHYSAPDRRSVIIDGGRLRIVWPSRGIDRATPIGSIEKRIQQYFVDTSPSQLRSHFDIAARVASDRPGTWFVAMTPKRKQIAAGVSQLDLWIRTDTVLLAAMRMVFRERGDQAARIQRRPPQPSDCRQRVSTGGAVARRRGPATAVRPPTDAVGPGRYSRR